MKRIIFAYLLMVLYKVEFKKEKNPWGRTCFRFHPRKLNIYIVFVIITPLVFIYAGVMGVYQLFYDKLKIENYTSYFFAEKEPETKLNAFKKW